MRLPLKALVLVAASPLLFSGCTRYFTEPSFGQVPATWVSSSEIDISMTGVKIRGRDAVADIGLQQPQPFTWVPSEVERARDVFAPEDPPIRVFPQEGFAGGTVPVGVVSASPPVYYTSAGSAVLPERPVAAPPAPPVASVFSHATPAAGTASDSPGLMPTIVDARRSTGTGPLTYSWDTDGNGVFGDDPTGRWLGVAPPGAGQAYVPYWSIHGASGTLAVSVKVTDAGNRSSTARLDLPWWSGGAGAGRAFRAGAEERVQPDVGTLVNDQAQQGSARFACLDLGDDGTWDGLPLETYPVFGSPGRYQFADSWIVSLQQGVTPVAIAYLERLGPSGGCASTGTPISTVRFLAAKNGDGDVESSGVGGSHEMAVGAGQPRVRGYAARATVRLRGGRVVSMGASNTSTYTRSGFLTNGRFSMSAPARSAGGRRPAAVSLFRRGTFAARSTVTVLVGTQPNGASMPSIGATTMLVRGAGGVLGCFRIERTAASTMWRYLGGTGAARRLQATLSGGPTANDSLNAISIAGTRRFGQAAVPFAVRASSRRGPSLPSACRRLIRHLP